MKYYKVDVDFTKNADCYDTVTVGNDTGRAYKTVKEYLLNNWKVCLNEPIGGKLKYKFVTPGGGYKTLWDWDSFFMCSAIPDEGLEYIKGSIIDLLDSADPQTGKPAKNVSADGTQDPVSAMSHPYPLQAQFAYITAKRLNDFAWIEPYWDTLERMICWFDNNCKRDGFYVWTSMYGNGIDNNPAVYGRARMSSAGVDLAAFFYREFLAMAKISRKLSAGRDDYYINKADRIKHQIEEYYFDEVDKCFYNIDCSTNFDDITLQKVNWVTHIKTKNCAVIFPLWAKAASNEQAEYMKEKIMDEKEFLSVCGIRSHSKNDMVYNNEPMGNPSNWQGPVWGLSTFIAAYGLARYGYKQEALEVAGRLVRTFAADIEQNGSMHEIYHGDTGQPVMRRGFLSWNMLALKAIDDIICGTDCTSYDLFE